MKLTREDVIKSGEKRLIDLIIQNIDKAALKAAIQEKYDLAPGDDISFYDGDLVIHGDKIAYKVDFGLSVHLSVIFDRSGNHMAITASEPPKPHARSNDPILLAPQDEYQRRETDQSAPDDQTSRMAAEIAQMISEINNQ